MLLRNPALVTSGDYYDFYDFYDLVSLDLFERLDVSDERFDFVVLQLADDHL